MPNKRGRPRKESGPTKGAPLQIRAEHAEKEAFYDAAAIAGLSFSGWARERLRIAARKELKAAGKTVPFLDADRRN